MIYEIASENCLDINSEVTNNTSYEVTFGLVFVQPSILLRTTIHCNPTHIVTTTRVHAGFNYFRGTNDAKYEEHIYREPVTYSNAYAMMFDIYLPMILQ